MTKQEFKSLILPSKEKLFRVAFTLLKNRQDAEDALQEICLRLWDMRRSLAEYRSVEALAVTMIKNHCIDRLRSYRSRKQDEAGPETMKLSGSLPDPEEQMFARESVSAIHRIVEGLPERQRLIMHLRDIEQYEYEEIEEITGMTVNNIRVTLSRARKHVRETYMKYQDYEQRQN